LHKVSYRFEDFEALERALDADDTDLELTSQVVKDGQWLLATFLVGEESTSVAGRVIDRGDTLWLTFEERDRLRLRDFAGGNTRPSMRPSQAGTPVSLPPGSSALVVSGSAAVAKILAQLIESWGAAVDAVGSVEDALDRLRARSVDVVVLDSTLPGLGCDDLCRGLTRSGIDKPCVLLLGDDPTCADAHAAVVAGADDFVQKPFRAQELRARLVGLLEQRERLAG
jgi:CheY-like chemotaxis protein